MQSITLEKTFLRENQENSIDILKCKNLHITYLFFLYSLNLERKKKSKKILSLRLILNKIKLKFLKCKHF